jgi:hypothetical protein
MKNAIYKDHLIYLSLIAILVWTGGFFTGSAMSYTEWAFWLKTFAIPILLINSFIIYLIIQNIFNNQFISFSIGLLYLASFTHIDVFIYRIQFQALLAEMFILLFFYFYRLEKRWKSLIFLLIGILLNTKLLFLSILLWRNKKFSLFQKVLSLASILIVLLYISPLMFKHPLFLQWQFKTIPLVFKNLILPLDFTILNLATITPSFNKFDISIFALFLIYLYIFRKSNVARIIFSFVFISLAGSFIPFKQVYVSEDYFYYYLPSLYPLILLSLLLIIAFVMSRLEFKKNINRIIVIFLALYWMGATFIIQNNFQNIVNEWTYSIVSLPEHYNNEEIIKFKYAELLINNQMFNIAKMFIDDAKKKFPNERWYLMLADMAARKGDLEEVERVYKELNKSKAPLGNEEFEE